MKFKIYLSCEKQLWEWEGKHSKDGFDYSVRSDDWVGDNGVLISEMEIDFPVPEHFNPAPGAVEVLETKKTVEQAKFNELMKRYDDEIKTLLCITHEEDNG